MSFLTKDLKNELRQPDAGKYALSLEYEISGGGENDAKQLLILTIKHNGSLAGVVRSS